MEAFTCRFSAQIDSKGRVTIPARIRSRLELEKGKNVSLKLESSKVIRKEVENYQQALQFVRRFESVSSFSYTEGTIKVILDG